MGVGWLQISIMRNNTNCPNINAFSYTCKWLVRYMLSYINTAINIINFIKHVLHLITYTHSRLLNIMLV